MSDLINVKGLKELDAMLKTLPAKMQRSVVRGAMRAGANKIKKQAIANAPEGKPSKGNQDNYGGYPGALRDSIRVTSRAKGGQITASVKAGGKNKKTGSDVYYAHFVEFGTAPHIIKGPIKLGDKVLKNVKHPGAQAKPFMRPAMDSAAKDAVTAAGNYMKKRLAKKHGLDTGSIEIGGDDE
ncbi:MAG: HK97 gp10 family phage protein [Gammaproteobacteria bacterium]